MPSSNDYDVVVIGSGFGGSMTGLTLAREFAKRNMNEKMLMLERGTWWTTPVSTVQDKEVTTYTFLKDYADTTTNPPQPKPQPVQLWPAVDHFKGLIDLFTRCVRRNGNEDGLYDLTNFGQKGFLGLVLNDKGKGDGITILRASGVGGGSLVYSNVTIQPPDFIFQDWSLNWGQKGNEEGAKEREAYFNLARHAIGYGVVSAWDEKEKNNIPYPDQKLPARSVNTGLSNIATRSAGLDPHWNPKNKRVKQLDPAQLNLKDPTKPFQIGTDSPYRFWIDRARIFQTAMQLNDLTADYGTVDSSINNISLEPHPLEGGGDGFKTLDPSRVGKNYCERQGRCNVGCLPGARHTLNKQLMKAILGMPDGTKQTFPNMHLEALAEVDKIEPLEKGGGYTVYYNVRDPKNPSNFISATPTTVTADRVIVAAGCVGTNEIMLRSRDKGKLSGLSDKTGYGFSTNGDFLGFMINTDKHVNLTRGPVTTSFAHFNTPEQDPKNANPDTANFYTIEDQGFPRAFSSLFGVGLPIVHSVDDGPTSRNSKQRRTRKGKNLVSSVTRNHHWVTIWRLLKAAVRWLIFRYLPAIFRNPAERQYAFWSEDEYTDKMMCIAAMGRAKVVGKFRLGDTTKGETPLRLSHVGELPFHKDPIYTEIKATLKKFRANLLDEGNRKNTDDYPEFENPLENLEQTDFVDPITISHPLGGCRMAKDVTEGVVDEYGRVFDKAKHGQDRPFYEGLYIADASIIPTALGVNPSLTISALALRIANNIVQEIRAAAPATSTAPAEPAPPAASTPSAAPATPTPKKQSRSAKK